MSYLALALTLASSPAHADQIQRDTATAKVRCEELYEQHADTAELQRCYAMVEWAAAGIREIQQVHRSQMKRLDTILAGKDICESQDAMTSHIQWMQDDRITKLAEYEARNPTLAWFGTYDRLRKNMSRDLQSRKKRLMRKCP